MFLQSALKILSISINVEIWAFGWLDVTQPNFKKHQLCRHLASYAPNVQGFVNHQNNNTFFTWHWTIERCVGTFAVWVTIDVALSSKTIEAIPHLDKSIRVYLCERCACCITWREGDLLTTQAFRWNSFKFFIFFLYLIAYNYNITFLKAFLHYSYMTSYLYWISHIESIIMHNLYNTK